MIALRRLCHEHPSTATAHQSPKFTPLGMTLHLAMCLSQAFSSRSIIIITTHNTVGGAAKPQNLSSKQGMPSAASRSLTETLNLTSKGYARLNNSPVRCFLRGNSPKRVPYPHQDRPWGNTPGSNGRPLYTSKEINSRKK